jgi:hypothetical protein
VKLILIIEKTNNDTYLKIFDNILTLSPLKPNNPNILNSDVKIELNKIIIFILTHD